MLIKDITRSLAVTFKMVRRFGGEWIVEVNFFKSSWGSDFEWIAIMAEDWMVDVLRDPRNRLPLRVKAVSFKTDSYDKRKWRFEYHLGIKEAA